MANSTIPNLVAVTVPALTDLFGVRQSGDTRDKKLTASQLLSLSSVPDPLLLSAGAVGAPTYSFSGDPDTGVFNTAADQLSLAAGGAEGARVTEGVGVNQFAIAVSGSSVVPDLTSLSDSDTGIRWTGANEIITVNGGARSWHFLSTAFFADASDGPIIFNTFGSATVPSICVERADIDTGLGRGANDAISLICGGVEGLRLTEASLGVIQVPEADLAITAFATGGQVGATQLNSSYNVLTTVASLNDSVKLPPTFAVNSVVFIKNNGANAADVFPASGDDLGAGTDTAVSLAAGSSISFIATVASLTWTQWIIDTVGAVPDPLLLSAGSVGAPSYSFSGDPDTGVFNTALDQLGLVAGGVEIARLQESTEDQLIVSPGAFLGSATLPALAFGDGDTGFLETFDDVFQITIGGVVRFTFADAANSYQGFVTGAGSLRNETSSITNPTLGPRNDDADTGIGSGTADTVSIIGGGVELARFTEVVGSEQLLILNNDNTGVPDLGSLGDPDTGWHWTTANAMAWIGGGSRAWNLSTAQFFSQFSNGAAMINAAASSGQAVFRPDRSDADTGIGTDSADGLQLISGGVVGLALNELNASVIQVPEANLAITARAGGAQALATQLDSSHSVITTVATTGDSVKLPLVFAVNSVMFIKNDGVNAADVFPGVGDDLGAGLNTAISLAAGESASFIATVVNLTWTPWIVSVGGGGGGDVTKVGTPVNNQVGIWTGDGTLEGDADLTFDGTILTTGATGRIRSGFGSFSSPAFSFGSETNTGIYRQAAGSLGISLSGSGNYLFQAGSFFANIVGGPQMMVEASSATNPVFIPRLSDTDTGIGSGAADQMDLIAGALSCMAVRETGGARQIGFYTTAPISLQTGVAVTAGAIHAALVALGLITA